MGGVTVGSVALFGMFGAMSQDARPLAIALGTADTVLNVVGWHRIHQNMQPELPAVELLPLPDITIAPITDELSA